MTPSEQSGDVIKGGEHVLVFSLRRSKAGTFVHVKASSEVEDFFRHQLADAEPESVEAHSRGWISKEKLMIWPIPGGEKTHIYSGGSYTLKSPGRQLWFDASESGVSGGLLNMSFLRLVGISRPEGVSFQIRQAGDDSLLKEIVSKIQAAGAKFYRANLQPVDYTVIISQQETRG